MTERINADFSRSAIVRTNGMEWRPSPASGVWRKRLELVGEAEAGRVTSVVRFDPGAEFTDHGHPGVEEMLVLDGVFSDETGDYPAGSYLLNPEGTGHAPWSAQGCTLFVKLRQYPGTGRTGTVVDTRSAEWRPGHTEGTEVLPLQADPAPGEGIVRLIRMAPGCAGGREVHPGGFEVFVIDGCLEDDHGRHDAGTWFRHPPGSVHRSRSREGCTLYMKQGHFA